MRRLLDLWRRRRRRREQFPAAGTRAVSASRPGSHRQPGSSVWRAAPTAPPRQVSPGRPRQAAPTAVRGQWPVTQPQLSSPPPMVSERHLGSTAWADSLAKPAGQSRTSRSPGHAASRAAIRDQPRSGAPRSSRGTAAPPRPASAVPYAVAAPAAAVTTADAAATRTVRSATAIVALPWYERARAGTTRPGHRHCGILERILRREWAADEVPPTQIIHAVDRLAELPQLIKERLVSGLDAIHVGPGGVPDLDDMAGLTGVVLPSGHATWDRCAGAYGERKVIVGSRPSPSPDVMCHEIGHALDDIDGSGDRWQSDLVEFSQVYRLCLPSLIGDLHRQPGQLGRREFFADAFAAIASSQRPALVEMVGGNTRAALEVMLYFNVRYGI
jgi:hypothetical protein